jgi:hypothetical protein
MTSQIVEEQTDFVEEKIEKIKGDSKKYTHIIVSDDDLRSFASTLIERVGSELIGEDEQHESGSNTMDDEKVTRNDFRASQRTKLREMR